MKNLRFIILSGIPCSGKSTYAAKLAKEIGAEIVCPDTLRKEVTGSESDMSRDGYIWGSLVEERIKLFALIREKSILFDATQINKRARKPILEIAKRLGNIQIECHYFVPNKELAKQRNLLRTRQVPEKVIDSFTAKWECPSLEEGFHSITQIE